MTVGAQVEVLPSGPAPVVFAGQRTELILTVRNRAADSVKQEMAVRLHQMSTGILAPVGEAFPWKKIELLPQQTALETLAIDVPEVRVMTRFLVQIFNEQRQPAGRRDFWACPTGVLLRLNELAGDGPIGIFDPENRLKPTLEKSGVTFVDLENGAAPSALPPSLVIFRPSAERSSEEISARLARWSSAKVCTIALLPAGMTLLSRRPEVRIGNDGKNVALSADILGSLDSAEAQATLVELADLALRDRRPSFPP